MRGHNIRRFFLFLFHINFYDSAKTEHIYRVTE